MDAQRVHRHIPGMGKSTEILGAVDRALVQHVK